MIATTNLGSVGPTFDALAGIPFCYHNGEAVPNGRSECHSQAIVVFVASKESPIKSWICS
jgi:hypothetical protein